MGDGGRYLRKLFLPNPRRVDQFGVDTAIDEDVVMIGAPLDDDAGFEAGAVAVFAAGACARCVADVNDDGWVDMADLDALLAAWAEMRGREDLDQDGDVDFADLLILLAAWGPCE